VTDSDRATAEAIARKIREGTDPDVIAVEIIAVIRGRGWRPTEARAGAPPLHAAPVADKPPRDELLRDLRADVEARAAAARRDGSAA
jgi:hypothetical protein